LRLLGRGDEEIIQGFNTLEPVPRASVRNMQIHLRFDAQDTFDDMNARSRQRGIALQLLASPTAVRSNPLLTSQYPGMRLAPVFMPLLFIDDSLIVVGGAKTARGEATAWVTEDAELVGRANHLWEQTFAVSVLALPEGRPPLSPRQVQTAHLVAQGATDERICRELHVSTRTVVGDIRAICDVLGARNRTDMVARLMRHAY
jgi:DNA-binding CsgD family transcriptional regulator